MSTWKSFDYSDKLVKKYLNTEIHHDKWISFEVDGYGIFQFSPDTPPLLFPVKENIIIDKVILESTKNAMDVGEVEKIDDWIEKSNLPGDRLIYYKMISPAFTTTLGLDIRLHSKYFSMIRETWQSKYKKTIKRLGILKKAAKEYLKKFDSNPVMCIYRFYEDIEKHLADIESKSKEYIKISENIKKHTKSGKYAFIRLYIDVLKDDLNEVGIKKTSEQVGIIYELFKAFDFGDFDFSVKDPNFINKQKRTIKTAFFKKTL
ncbi:MAG: hypothetical protein HQ510_12735 [Candidatus Marinimicrobia bacterium]|nr:hypothetical protein [Candidatus Neomarinimicrobiota bacterium]